jgi:hypothetical protein
VRPAAASARPERQVAGSSRHVSRSGHENRHQASSKAVAAGLRKPLENLDQQEIRRLSAPAPSGPEAGLGSDASGSDRTALPASFPCRNRSTAALPAGLGAIVHGERTRRRRHADRHDVRLPARPNHATATHPHRIAQHPAALGSRTSCSASPKDEQKPADAAPARTRANRLALERQKKDRRRRPSDPKGAGRRAPLPTASTTPKFAFSLLMRAPSAFADIDERSII